MKLQHVSLSDIHPFHADENVARSGQLFKDDADRHVLISNMVNGWNVELGLAMLYPLDDSKIKQAVTELKEQWKVLKEATERETVKVNNAEITVLSSDRLAAWEAIHVKGNKVIAPKYGVVAAFRRTTIMPDVNAVRARMELEPLTTIPASIKEYATDLERKMVTVRENQSKLAGALAMSASQVMSAAKSLFDDCATESQLMTEAGFKRGTAQKLFRICKLDKRFPEAGLIDAILADDVKLASIDKELVQQALKDDDLTADALSADFGQLVKSAKNSPKIASKKEIEAIKEQHPVVLVNFVANAIMANDIGRLAVLKAVAKPLNEAIGKILADNGVTLS